MTRPLALIVDASAATREQLQSALGVDHECLAFADLASALAAALRRPPQLIFSDDEALCGLVRATPALRGVPFVLLTSVASTRRDAGLADDYLRKPVDAREAVARARLLLKLRGAQQEIQRQKDAVTAGHQDLFLAQRQLIAFEKLAAVGTLAAGIAHEINNPLGFVLSGVTELVGTAIALTELASPLSAAQQQLAGELTDIQADVLTGLERIRLVVLDLGLLTPELDRPPAPLEVAGEIERALAIAVVKLDRVTLVRDLADAGQVCVTPGCITQIVLNLVENAADAVAKVDQPKITVRARRTSAGVEISVSDNGTGIPTQVLPRVFEPFFTTKFAGSGAGLGLSVCSSLARRLGGSLSVQTVLNEGAVFTLTIPEQMISPETSFGQIRVQAAQNG